ncbi:MAG: DUF1566 domain-containing protein [Proteobacteria bacterium]|nr:DUF1566 domain-containing protein [Pseudomonadota bacterium]
MRKSILSKVVLLSTLIFFAMLTNIAFSGTVNLPESGQTKCYDTAGVEIPCTGTGQDGEIQAGVAWPDPRFTTNVDTTITDNLTGLVWAPNGNIMPTRDPGWDTDYTVNDNDGMVTWQHALDYVAKLNSEDYLGHTDWRLPNVNELESLFNAGEADNAAWINTQGFANVQANYYWSSTTHAYFPDVASFVDMETGYVGYIEKSDFHYLWPVRGGQCGSFGDSVICLPQTGQKVSYAAGDDGDLEQGVAWPVPRFTDHGNGSVTDNLTGLMWTKNANLPNGGIIWQQALDYVATMNAGTYPNFGYTDWRLPNRKELQSLTDFSKYGPALPTGHPFTNVQVFYYWSSTTSAVVPDHAWVVYMFDGYVGAAPKSDNHPYVWPVRGPESTLNVNIDIKPGSFPNSINFKSKGNVPVAILSSPTFDATTVDWDTVEFAGAPALPIGGSPEDVNSDGLLDLVLHFSRLLKNQVLRKIF